MKILAVDDSKAILRLVNEILTIHKYEVETADNGAQALDKYTKFKPDIVTLDLTMPLMDGYETLKRILAIDKTANVIMLTASEQQETLEKCLERGAMGYLAKPFTAKELITTITNAWSAGSDKNIAALFSLATSKIETSIKKMSNSDASVILSNIEVIRQHASTQVISPNLDTAQIRVIPSVMEELKIEAPRDCVGYITDFGGQQEGVLVSFIKKDNLLTLFSTDDEISASEQAAEFFNIINTKILSELANATHLILKFMPTRFYNGMPDNRSYGSEITKATFEIVINQNKIPIEVQLWFNTAQVFRGRF